MPSPAIGVEICAEKIFSNGCQGGMEVFVYLRLADLPKIPRERINCSAREWGADIKQLLTLVV